MPILKRITRVNRPRKNSKNKTRKLFTGSTIPKKMIETKNHLYNETNREKSLACYLANHRKVKQFAFDVFWFMITYWRNNYPQDWKHIIGDDLLEKVDGNIIGKIGFSPIERNEIYRILDKNDKHQMDNYLENKFHKVTSILNNLSKPDYAYYHLKTNKKLQQVFIDNITKLFLVTNFTWEKFEHIYHTSPKSHRKSYNFFIFDMIVNGGNYSGNMSLYKKNLVYLDFIKKNLDEKDKNNPDFLNKITNCNKSIVGDNNDYTNYKIYDARNYYFIDKQMPYAKIMHNEDKKTLAGPSGSTSILYINLFYFYGMSNTKYHKVMLLALIIADYIPLWHTLPEILLSSSIELSAVGIPRYNLKTDPVNYVDRVISKYIH